MLPSFLLLTACYFIFTGSVQIAESDDTEYFFIHFYQNL